MGDILEAYRSRERPASVVLEATVPSRELLTQIGELFAEYEQVVPASGPRPSTAVPARPEADGPDLNREGNQRGTNRAGPDRYGCCGPSPRGGASSAKHTRCDSWECGHKDGDGCLFNAAFQ